MIQQVTFGEVIKKLREEIGLPLRKVAAHLDIDPSTLGKIERNERSANKEMIEKFAVIFSINSKTLLVSFLSDKVAYEIMEYALRIY
jgi:transcriptional regulator with XRE-family HTH domain